ncbi:OmpA family protein [Aquimarina brevivitae]|uniref:Putative repeat protein (TIGR01451 family) n=1 Tax=Aquimarina brevivitae TaxID=323412 RepID=A0A4Q7P2X7_9FLAO|nr:OmpA family protein [Aquimarina brevivitae]RZS93740.1 putative repeat protein (TIGR01451 family) [Aquimarina brevivitae]
MEKLFLHHRRLLGFQILGLLIFNFFYNQSLSAQVEVPLTKRTEFTLKGDFKFVSNTVLGKVSHDDGSQVFDPNNSYNDGGLNNQFKMGFIDIDDDPSTFNSSSADLDLETPCNSIKHVGLYWTASYADTPRAHDIRSIKIKYPGNSSYTTLTGAEVIHDYYKDPNSDFKQYSCYKDITEDVLRLASPIGTYTVANIPATTTEVNDDEKLGNGLAGGWTMVVIYQDDNKQRKRFYVYDGFVNIDSQADPVDFSFNNFQTIPKGAVNGKIGVIAYEGDKGIRGDRFQVYSNEAEKYRGITDSSNPMNNFFNANITENGRNVKTRVPASENTLGYDADLFSIKNSFNSIIGNNQTEAKFRLLTDNDGYSVMAVAFSIEIYEPAIQVVKRSKYPDNKFVYPNDLIAPDQQITYSLKVYNDGNDDAKNTIIKDQLPKNVILSEESITLPSKRIKYHYNEESGSLSFSIPDKFVKLNSEPVEISYSVQVNTGCSLLEDTYEIFIEDEPVFAEFSGSLNDNRVTTKGFNHINKCNFPDFYRLKLAVDMSGLNCPNYIRLANRPDKELTEKNTEITEVSEDKNTESSGIEPNDVVANPTDPTSERTATTKVNKTIQDLIELNEIYFEFDKWDITPRAEIELTKIVNLMTTDYPDMIIRIETHSDSRGEKLYNLELSQKRAESIYQYLISKDISKNRILSYIGYGESRPINKCKDGEDCSEKEYKLNRRSSFVIMD